MENGPRNEGGTSSTYSGWPTVSRVLDQVMRSVYTWRIIECMNQIMSSLRQPTLPFRSFVKSVLEAIRPWRDSWTPNERLAWKRGVGEWRDLFVRNGHEREGGVMSVVTQRDAFVGGIADSPSTTHLACSPNLIRELARYVVRRVEMGWI